MFKLSESDQNFDVGLGKSFIHVQGGPKKRHKVYGTIILQPYITVSCSFHQNVLKEILYIQASNILCFCCWQVNY